MLISFFEEFPTAENLAKLKLITWPTKLYVAAKSVEEFKKTKKSIKNKQQIQECIYWPILEKKEGYWISPFSKRKALLRIFDELKHQTIPVMLDLELPITRNPFLFLTQLLNFTRNKNTIKDFIVNYKGKVYLAEYYPEGKRKEQLLQKVGLHYPKAIVIKMLYHSLHQFSPESIKYEINQGNKEHAQLILAFGTIAAGITKKEPLLSSQQLKKDVILAKKLGVKEVIIFRLGGLNREYLKILK